MVPAAIFRSIESLLKQECALQRRYNELLAEERKAITAYKTQKVQELAEKREAVCGQISQARDRRLQMMRALPGGQDDKARLSELVRRHADRETQRRLMPLLTEFQDLLKQSRSASTECSQVTGFALNLVNGFLTTFWSATQTVVQTYSPQGYAKESYHPAGSRRAAVLSEA